MSRGTKKEAVEKIKVFLQNFKDGYTTSNLQDSCHYCGLHHTIGMVAKEMGLLEKTKGKWRWVKGDGKITEEMAQQIQELSSAYTNARV